MASTTGSKKPSAFWALNMSMMWLWILHGTGAVCMVSVYFLSGSPTWIFDHFPTKFAVAISATPTPSHQQPAFVLKLPQVRG